MKQYTFLVKKELEKKININAENSQSAINILVELLDKNDENIFKKENLDKEFLDIKLENIVEIRDKKHHKKSNNNYTFNIKNSEKYDEDLSQKPRVFDEIICDKCGNCIPLE